MAETLPRFENLDMARSTFEKIWEEIPVFKDLATDIFESIDQNEPRNFMLKLMREGIHDENYAGKARHVFSGVEMFEAYTRTQDLGKEIRKNTFYYHLGELEKADLVKKVCEIKQGKRWVTYYVRTAQLFLAVSDGNGKPIQEKLQILHKIILDTRLDVSEAELAILSDKLAEKSSLVFEKQKDWVMQHRKKFDELEVNIWELFQIFAYFQYSDPELAEIVQQYQKLLDL